MMKVGIVAIAKDEEQYLAEWLNYHSLLGFDRFYVYDNSANNRLMKFATDSVKIIYYPGQTKQVQAYNDFIQNFSNEVDYVIALDIDEFLVIHNGLSLVDFITTYLKSTGVCINWRFFGSNGHKYFTDSPVLDRFTMRQPDFDHNVKTLVKTECLLRYSNPHCPDLLTVGQVTDLFGNPINLNEPLSNSDTTSIAQINHYFCKSWQEFNWKINRGRATTVTERRSTDDFIWSNRNDVTDLSAIQIRDKKINHKNVPTDSLQNSVRHKKISISADSSDNAGS